MTRAQIQAKITELYDNPQNTIEEIPELLENWLEEEGVDPEEIVRIMGDYYSYENTTYPAEA